MSTIPQRLREIAVRLRKPRDGRPWGADDGAADLLDAIAAELEAPDAVPAQENRHGSVALQYLREEVARAMAPVHAAFDERSKAEKPAADAVPVVAYQKPRTVGCVRIDSDEVHLYPLIRDREQAGLRDGELLVSARDHLATVAALQARIDELESRWNLCSACNAELGGAK